MHSARAVSTRPSTRGPYLAWLAVELVERLPGAFVRLLPLEFGRFRYENGATVLTSNRWTSFRLAARL